MLLYSLRPIIYPFGLDIKERSFQSDAYRYGFQGQEEDPEWLAGAVSYKYRIHNKVIGRFLSIDPLAPEYPWNSPYAFSENRVIDGVELEGLEYTRKTSPSERTEEGYTTSSDNIITPTQRPLAQTNTNINDITPTTFLTADDRTNSERQASYKRFRTAQAEAYYQSYVRTGQNLSPFVFGGIQGNPFGFASTTATAIKEAPYFFAGEFAMARIINRIRYLSWSYKVKQGISKIPPNIPFSPLEKSLLSELSSGAGTKELVNTIKMGDLKLSIIDNNAWNFKND